MASGVPSSSPQGFSERGNPLQQRAAAAARALLAPERKSAPREIQAMLEKNEAALRGWNALHKQQPPMTNVQEHKEWIKKCLTLRQQIGARLEVLASLADKQIAQEDEKSGRRVSPTAAAGRTETLSSVTSSVPPQQLRQPSHGVSSQGHIPPQVPTVNKDHAIPVSSSAGSMGPVPASAASSAAMMMPAVSPPTMFPEPPMPTMGFSSTSTNIFFPAGQNAPMQTSSGFSSTSSMATSGSNTSTQGFAMSSGSQTFTPNAYMTTTSGPASSSATYMNQQNYMMGGMMNQQQFMPMPMPMELASGNMYGNNNSYNMSSTSASSINNGSNTSGGSNISNNSSNGLPADPFNTPLGFGPNAGFTSMGFPMAGMAGMPQMMAPMNAGNFGMQGSTMMPNNFGYGAGIGMPLSMPPASQGMMQPQVSTQQFQSAQSGMQSFQPQQQQQLSVHSSQQTGTGSMNVLPDSALYGDSTNINIFEGLSDDAFFPMQ